MHKWIQHSENPRNTQIVETQQICASWNYLYDINISLFCQLAVLLDIVVYCYDINFRKAESKCSTFAPFHQPLSESSDIIVVEVKILC